jgi:hypothetical protein
MLVWIQTHTSYQCVLIRAHPKPFDLRRNKGSIRIVAPVNSSDVAVRRQGKTLTKAEPEDASAQDRHDRAP